MFLPNRQNVQPAKKECNPGDKGCTLYTKAVFSNPLTPLNEAVKRREEIAKKRKERGYC